MLHYKRGQLTLFVIVGVVLVIIIGGFFFLSRSSSTSSSSSIESAFVDSLVDCFEFSDEASLQYVGIQGGYYGNFEGATELFVAGQIPYYYDSGDVVVPSLETVSSELSQAATDSLEFCLDADLYSDVDFTYNEDYSVTARIEEDRVVFEHDVVLDVTRESGASQILVDDEVILDSSLRGMHEIASYIGTSHEEGTSYLCVTCVQDLALEHELFVDFIPYPAADDTLSVVISESRNETVPYIYQFLNDYGDNENAA